MSAENRSHMCWARLFRSFTSRPGLPSADLQAQRFVNRREREGWSLESQSHWPDTIRVVMRRSRERNRPIEHPEGAEPVVDANGPCMLADEDRDGVA